MHLSAVTKRLVAGPNRRERRPYGERARAGQLLLRELRGRYVRACESAVVRLQQLANQRARTDCLTRRSANRPVAYWTRVVDMLPARALP